MQDALFQLVVVKPQFSPQRLKLAAAVRAEVDHLADIVGRLGGSTLGQKRQGPAPLSRIQAWPEKQWGIGLE